MEGFQLSYERKAPILEVDKERTGENMKVMGIDIGTTSISIVLLDSETGELAARETVNHKSFLAGETPEDKIQDPERIWRFTKEKVDELIHTYGAPKGIGLTGQMHGMLYVDKEGKAVGPLYTWQDGNGNKIFAEGKSCVNILRERVGNAATGYGLTTHFYLQKTGKLPEYGVKMTTISDYIAMKLCGRSKPVIGMDMAASWGCYDLKDREFRYEALEKAGVDISYIPEVRKDCFVVGETQEGIPVMGAIGDNQASFRGAVTNLPDTVLVNVGTGGQVTFLSEKYVPCEGNLELRPFSKDSYILAGSSLCGGRAYAMLEQFYQEVSGRREENHYGLMYEQAKEFIEQYGTEAAWKVRTTFSGTRENPNERGSISGISVENFHPGAMTVGVIMGILEESYQQYKEMCRLTGKKAEYLVGSGNGIRQNRLMQELAEEMYGLKLKIPRWEEEAACGAAICMAEELLKS